MSEFQIVKLPQGQWRSGQEDQKINEELQTWVAAGWEPVSISRPQTIGPINVLFRR